MRERELGWPGPGFQIEIDGQQLAPDCHSRVTATGHQVSTDQACRRHRDLMKDWILCDLPQEADLFERLQVGDHAARRIGKPKLLRLFDRAISAEIYERPEKRVSPFIQQQKPFRKAITHE